jgi:CheY-like chemotaxis protein
MSDRKANIDMMTKKEPVLIVEDTKENQDLLAGLCRRIGVNSDIAENGQVALDMSAAKKYSIFIVDLMMPVMDGKTFIEKIKHVNPEAIILVQTALDSSDTIIQIMKMGVFDYIIKPIDPELLSGSLYKAFDYLYLRTFEHQQSLAAGLKIRNQIEWLSYKDTMRIAAKEGSDTKSIYNLKTSLAQGAGFGSLVTLIDLMVSSAEKKEDKYLIDSQILDLINTNNGFCRQQLEGLHSAADIMEQDISLEPHTGAELVAELPDMFSTVIPYLEEKKLSLTYPELRENCRLNYNREKIALILEELMVNAYKYALHGSVINIFTRISEGYFWLSVKNDIRLKPYGGVPVDMEKLVLEPFFRIQPPDESAARFERIGFGLGLAVSDYVMKKHNGLMIVHDVKDLTGDKERPCVLAEILLPIDRGREV